MMASAVSLLPPSSQAPSRRCWQNPPQRSLPRMPRTSWTALLFVLACFVCHALAVTPTTDYEELADMLVVDTDQPVETLVLDPRVEYQEDGTWIILSEEEVIMQKLRKRAKAETKVTSTVDIAVSTSVDASSTTTTTTTTTTAAASPLPSPLDGALSANFTKVDNKTSPCPGFINSFLTSPTFQQCYPLSLLLQGSRSFFRAEGSLVSITQVLDATCHPNATFCNNYLNSLAQNLTAAENCQVDYDTGNPLVKNVYLAMLAYAPIYNAGCLKDPQTSMYCYADAITNLTNPSDVYFYYLPLNITLPGSTMPSCNQCLQQTMGVFQAATANRKQMIAGTYVSAAQQINSVCGPAFVNDTLAAEITSSAAFRGRDAGLSSLWMVTSVVLALVLVPWL